MENSGFGRSLLLVETNEVEIEQIYKKKGYKYIDNKNVADPGILKNPRTRVKSPVGTSDLLATV